MTKAYRTGRGSFLRRVLRVLFASLVLLLLYLFLQFWVLRVVLLGSDPWEAALFTTQSSSGAEASLISTLAPHIHWGYLLLGPGYRDRGASRRGNGRIAVLLPIASSVATLRSALRGGS
jgi:hypothetical protein